MAWKFNRKKIKMAEYLQSMNKELTIENRRRIFEIRNMMVDIPSNFSSEEENEQKCVCQKIWNIFITVKC